MMAIMNQITVGGLQANSKQTTVENGAPFLLNKKHRAVILPFSDELQGMFAQAPVIDMEGGKLIAVPHAPAETWLLQHRFGLPVPAPILEHYEFPSPTDQVVFEAQKQTAALLSMNGRAYVLNGLGTGKTRASLYAWDYLNKLGYAGKLLVVAPLSTLHFTWGREIFSTLPHRKCAVLHGSRDKRTKRLADPEVDIFIINHDGLRVILPELYERGDINTLILDELAAYRNPKAKRTKEMMAFAKNKKFVWGMTGAPCPNAPTDVWGQCSIITPATVPAYFKNFQEQLMLRVSQFKWVPKPDALDRAFAAMQPSVRYVLDDIVELPEIIYRTIDVPMSAQQLKVYTDIKNYCYSALQAGEITAVNAGVALNKLLQVATGFVYTKDKKIATLDNGERMGNFIDLVESADQKIIVFTSFKHCLDGMSVALTKEKIEHAVVSGDTPAGERAEIFNVFQNTPKYHALLAHPACMAHGITLTAANTILWFNPTTSLETYEQGNARIRRIGQKRKQLILHLQASPAERHIYSLLQKRQAEQMSLLDMFLAATQ